MEMGRKLTPSQILLRFVINIFCDQNFKVLFSTPCSLFKEETVMMMMMMRRINIKATGDFYMVSYAAILHVVMHHSSLEESIVCSHKEQLCGRLTFTLH